MYTCARIYVYICAHTYKHIHMYTCVQNVQNVQKPDDDRMYRPKHVAILKIKVSCLMVNSNYSVKR